MPRPARTADSAEFWAWCSKQKLMIQQCASCGAFRMNPAPVCYACRSLTWTWVESRGFGKIYTYTIVHHPVHSAMRDVVPYNAVVVQLHDCGGVRLTSNIVGCRNDRVRIGLEVRLVWERVSDDLSLYRFEPAEDVTP